MWELGARLGLCQSQHWGVQGAGHSGSVPWPALLAFTQEPDLTSAGRPLL